MAGANLGVPPILLGSIPRAPVVSEGRFAFCPSPRKVMTKPNPKVLAEHASAEPSATSKIQVIEEEMDPNYEPTQEEVEEYAGWLGMDLESDQHLFWIAHAGLTAPCPKPWSPCRTEDGTVFYFNFQTGESIWDHPCDVHYTELYKQLRKVGLQGGASLVPSLCLAMPQRPDGAAGDLLRSPRKLTARGKQHATVVAKQNSIGIADAQATPKVTILEEQLDPKYEPTEEEVMEYAAWLGMDLNADKDLFWIARAGLKEPCPEPWKPCQTDSSDVFYFNFKTGDSIWDHPCDRHFKELYGQHKT